MALDRRPRLLFVEPDVHFLAALLPILESQCKLGVVTTPEQISALVWQEGLDVAIVNMEMNGLNGDFLLGAMGARYPSCRIIVFASVHDTLKPGFSAGQVKAICASPPAIGDALECLAACVPQLARRRLSRLVVTTAQEVAKRGVRDLSLGSLSNRIGTSRGQLAYLFRLNVGMSVGDYLRTAATWVARLLLRASDDKLDVVAEKSGFCDASHLSRVFHALTGVRPGEYRRGYERGFGRTLENGRAVSGRVNAATRRKAS